ncbi:MAG: enoyl-CoA hydratase/isomerase family protein [Caldilinea sp. CFX5]|nr:enoyl-CoA hydratase/isomerase family protein [Caldilinea sp. CFX5]
MFTVYATSGGGIVVKEETKQTAVKGREQNEPQAVASAMQPVKLVDESYPYWYEMAPTTGRIPRPTVSKESSNPVSRSNSPVLYERKGVIALITLNRPAVLNAIDMEMATLLKTSLQKASADQRVRTVILTGAGRGFCTGGDLRFAVAANPEQPGDSFLALTKVLHAAIAEIRNLGKPVIAAINGPAAGAGLFLALACDLRVMAEGTYLKQSNTSYGLSIPAGGAFLLPRLVGLGRALEIAMLDEPIPAARASALGLVTKVVPDTLVAAAAQQLAEQTAQRSMDALARTKQLMNSAFYHTLEEHLHLARQAIAASANSPEGREGLSAFLEKRKPDYAGVTSIV